MSNLLLPLAADEGAGLVPYAVGGGALLFLLVLLAAMMAFGGGREHS